MCNSRKLCVSNHYYAEPKTELLNSYYCYVCYDLAQEIMLACAANFFLCSHSLTRIIFSSRLFLVVIWFTCPSSKCLVVVVCFLHVFFVCHHLADAFASCAILLFVESCCNHNHNLQQYNNIFLFRLRFGHYCLAPYFLYRGYYTFSAS